MNQKEIGLIVKKSLSELDNDNNNDDRNRHRKQFVRILTYFYDSKSKYHKNIHSAIAKITALPHVSEKEIVEILDKLQIYYTLIDTFFYGTILFFDDEFILSKIEALGLDKEDFPLPVRTLENAIGE